MSNRPIHHLAAGSGFPPAQPIRAHPPAGGICREGAAASNYSAPSSPESPQSLDLVKIDVVEKALNLSRTTFWRFRKRHRIKTLPGATLCWADIAAAIDAERIGKRLYQINGAFK